MLQLCCTTFLLGSLTPRNHIPAQTHWLLESAGILLIQSSTSMTQVADCLHLLCTSTPTLTELCV